MTTEREREKRDDQVIDILVRGIVKTQKLKRERERERNRETEKERERKRERATEGDKVKT